MKYTYRPLAAGDEKYRVQFRDDESRSSLDELDSIIVPSSETGYSRTYWYNGLGKIMTSKWIWLVHVCLFTFSLTILALAANIRLSTIRHVREFSAWSPAASSVDYEHVRYNVSTKDNRFVGAGPEVDAAWREISYDMGDQWLSKSDFNNLDMPKSHLKVDHPTTGQEGYRVGVEVFHHLHCINLLRRVTYRDYYEPLGGEFAKGPEALKKHTDHCLEILRLNVQCNADVGVFSFYMIEGDPLAWPELNSKHVCRNFEKVRQWAVDNSVGNMEVLG